MKKITLLISFLMLLCWQAMAQPANDDISGAIQLTVGTGSCSTPLSGTTVAATNSGVAHSCANYQGGDVWYYVIVPTGGTFSVEGTDNSGFTDGGMQAYSGPSNALVSINCDDDDSPSGAMPGIYPADGLTGLTPGDTIWFAFWEYGDDNQGTFDICAWSPPPAPANDDISGAIALTLGTGSCSTPLSGTTASATNSGVAHSCANYQGGDVWYYVIVPAGGTFSVEGTANGGFTDGGMQAYSGPSNALVSINCDDDDSPSGAMPGIYPADGLTGLTPGDTIWFAFWEYGDDNQGTFEICAWGPPTCPDPTVLTATNITTTSADLGWTDASGSLWHIEWDTTGFTPGTGTIVNSLTATTHNLTGLTPNTSYDFYVISDCGADSSAWVGPFTFNTACNVFTVPFTENFTSTSTTQNCWTVINNNADGDLWDMDYATNPLTGDEVAVMYTDGNSGADDDFLVSPTITLTGNEQLRFHYRVQSAGEPNDFQVTLSTTGVGVANFTNTLLPLTSASNTTYQEQTINLSAYTGNVNIAFHIPPGITDGWRLYIDSVVVEQLPACPDPTMLTATNITATSTDLGWTDPSGSLWHIEWDTTGFTPGTGTMVNGLTATTHNLTGLSANTSYDFYVISDCGVDSSNWIGPFSFTTACNVFTVPFVENFNSNSTSQNCWTVIDNNTDGAFWDMDYTSNPLNGDEVAVMYTDFNSGNDDDFLVSPTITLTGAERLRFHYRVESASEPNDFQVTLSTTGVAPSNFTNTLMPLTTASNTNYIEQTISLAAYTGNVNIAFHIPPGTTDGWRLYIDSVVIEALPANDLGVVSIESAPSDCELGMETVTIKVVNFGANAESGFNVAYALNAGTPVVETVGGTVNPSDTLTFLFSTFANMTADGIYTIDAWTDLTTDVNNSNDTLLGWSAENITSSLSYSDSAYISNTLDSTNTVLCTDGLVNNMLDSCYTLSALVIDSLTHTYNGDINIWLISPAGDTLEVSTGNGGSTDNYYNVTFTDSATTNINGNNPVPGFYHTEELAGLAKFNGSDPNGAWTLLIIDDAGGDDGTLFDWHLEFTDYNFSTDLGTDTSACLTDTITLNAGTGNYSYEWSTGETTEEIIVDTNSLGGAGTYNISVVVTDTLSGCQSIDTIVVDFSVCAGINALTNNVNVNLYPNPNNGIFTLNVNTNDVNELSIKVVNLQGQEVYNRNNFDNLSTVNEQINLSNNANGIYFVIVTTDKGIVTHKMIVQ